jgi:hypothetical protein
MAKTKKKLSWGQCNNCWGPLFDPFIMSSYGGFCSDKCAKRGPKLMEVGDSVQVFFDEKIAKAKSGKKKDQVCPGVLELWEAINGHIGVVTNIVSDDEIWVRGNRTQKERMFDKSTLIRYEP